MDLNGHGDIPIHQPRPSIYLTCSSSNIWEYSDIPQVLINSRGSFNILFCSPISCVAKSIYLWKELGLFCKLFVIIYLVMTCHIDGNKRHFQHLLYIGFRQRHNITGVARDFSTVYADKDESIRTSPAAFEDRLEDCPYTSSKLDSEMRAKMTPEKRRLAQCCSFIYDSVTFDNISVSWLTLTDFKIETGRSMIWGHDVLLRFHEAGSQVLQGQVSWLHLGKNVVATPDIQDWVLALNWCQEICLWIFVTEYFKRAFKDCNEWWVMNE